MPAAALLAGVSSICAKAQTGSLGDKLVEASESAVALLRNVALPPRPSHIEDPAREFLFREERARHCPRNPSRPNDSWNHHGGTGKSRLPLPPHLQQGPEPQVLVRHSGFVMRTGLPTLRFHQYKILVVGQEKRRDVPVLFHVVHTFTRRYSPAKAPSPSTPAPGRQASRLRALPR